MGHLTTFTVYNDSCDEIPKHAQEFADKIYEACQSNKFKRIRVGGAEVICQKTRHANDQIIYAHGGNTVIEINYFEQSTIDLMNTSPEFFKEILDNMAYHVRELRKEYRAICPPKKRLSANEKIRKVLNDYCERHGCNIKLNFVVSGDKWCAANGEETYLNSSYNTHDEIWIGIYKDDSLKLASFFHELAHCTETTANNLSKTYYQIEKHAWKIGYELARMYNIRISKNAREWAKTRLETYDKPEYH
jgi:hypothetical protein